jgi:hypothetical protein
MMKVADLLDSVIQFHAANNLKILRIYLSDVMYERLRWELLPSQAITEPIEPSFELPHVNEYREIPLYQSITPRETIRVTIEGWFPQ